MKVVITGGAGYLGCVLVPALVARGHTVSVIDNLSAGHVVASYLNLPHQSRLDRADIRDAVAVSTAVRGADAVIHLAAIMGESACQSDPDTAHAVNVDATRTLLRTCRDQGIARFLFASSASNYGVTSPAQPAAEETPLQPLSLYARTKAVGEELTLSSKSATFAPTVFRLSTLMGLSPAMRFDVLLNQFIRDALVRGRLDVHGPNAWRPFVHVQDAAAAVATWLEADTHAVRGQVYNIGKGNYRKIDLANAVAQGVGHVEIVTTPASDSRDYCVAFAKAQDTLGVQPTLTIEAAVGEVVAAARSGLVALE